MIKVWPSEIKHWDGTDERRKDNESVWILVISSDQVEEQSLVQIFCEQNFT